MIGILFLLILLVGIVNVLAQEDEQAALVSGDKTGEGYDEVDWTQGSPETGNIPLMDAQKAQEAWESATKEQQETITAEEVNKAYNAVADVVGNIWQHLSHEAQNKVTKENHGVELIETLRKKGQHS